jgi:hypothetical protein
MLFLMYYYTVCFSLQIYRLVIQGDSGGKADILEGDSIGHFEKEVYMNIYYILNGYRDRAVRSYNHENIVNRNKGR